MPLPCAPNCVRIRRTALISSRISFRSSLAAFLPTTWASAKTANSHLAGVAERSQQKNPKPSLVICPASVLHNWRREANSLFPTSKVLVLESGAARHNLRKQIPEHDIIVTNYALLRRDLEELNKFAFRAVILDKRSSSESGRAGHAIRQADQV